MMDSKLQKITLQVQKIELTEYFVYQKLAKLTKNQENAAILMQIAEEEKKHAAFWKTITNKEVQPNRFKIFKRVLLAKVLGPTFVLKQMEKNEGTGSKLYETLSVHFPETKKLSEEEAHHEKQLINMIQEERLNYVGSIVLGLNDALVELTGALAGFTLALGDTSVISLAGLVTGLSAAMSMAASDYLSSKAEGDERAKRSALYTGMAYLITVILLILPFLLLSSKFLALGITLTTVVVIIYAFNYYLSIAKDLPFKERFTEMTVISLGVATLSFFIGFALKNILGVDA